MRYVFIILLLITQSSWAEVTLFDYFMTLDERANLAKLRNQASGENKVNKSEVLLDSAAIDFKLDEFRVNALIDAQNNKLVEINGVYLAEGETAAGIKVYTILNNYVVLSFKGIKGRALIGKKYNANNW